jgi:hypothetical protein
MHGAIRLGETDVLHDTIQNGPDKSPASSLFSTPATRCDPAPPTYPASVVEYLIILCILRHFLKIIQKYPENS